MSARSETGQSSPEQKHEKLDGNITFFPDIKGGLHFSWAGEELRGGFIPWVSGSLSWKNTKEGREYYFTTNEESYSGTEPFALPVKIMEVIVNKTHEIDDPEIPLKLDLPAGGWLPAYSEAIAKLADEIGKPIDVDNFGGFHISATPGSTGEEIYENFMAQKQQRSQNTQ